MFSSSHPGVGWSCHFLPLPGFQSRLLSHSAAAAEKLYHPRTARYANDALQQRSSKSRSVLATSNPIHRPQKKLHQPTCFKINDIAHSFFAPMYPEAKNDGSLNPSQFQFFVPHLDLSTDLPIAWIPFMMLKASIFPLFGHWPVTRATRRAYLTCN